MRVRENWLFSARDIILLKVRLIVLSTCVTICSTLSQNAKNGWGRKLPILHSPQVVLRGTSHLNRLRLPGTCRNRTRLNEAKAQTAPSPLHFWPSGSSGASLGSMSTNLLMANRFSQAVPPPFVHGYGAKKKGAACFHLVSHAGLALCPCMSTGQYTLARMCSPPFLGRGIAMRDNCYAVGLSDMLG